MALIRSQDFEITEFCYQSENISCQKEIRSNAIYSALYVFISTGILITIVGNLIVIISISHFKQLHTPSNILVLSLAVTDFLIAVLLMPIAMVRTVETCWYFGDKICFIYSFFVVALSDTSIVHLIFIAIDRYNAVCDPLLYPSKITVSVAWIFVVVCWVLPFMYTALIFYCEGNTNGVEEYKLCPGDCVILFNSLWGLIDTIIAFIIPCLLMVGMYVKVFFVARRHAKIIKDQSHFEVTKCTVSQKRERKATKTLGIVIGTFVTCWLPYCFSNILAPYFTDISTPVVVDALGWMAYFNSGFNPIIYGLFYPWFQKTLKLIVTFQIFKQGSSLINVFPEK